MPEIKFCFQGWVRGAEIKNVTDAEGELVDVSTMSPETLVQKLNNGELFISLADHLKDNIEEEIEIFDFETD